LLEKPSVVSNDTARSQRTDPFTDLFPSHGLRVSKNGTPQLTDIVNNVSFLPDSAVKGFRGLATIGAGLSFEGNSGMESVVPTDTGKTHSNNSLLCGF